MNNRSENRGNKDVATSLLKHAPESSERGPLGRGPTAKSLNGGTLQAPLSAELVDLIQSIESLVDECLKKYGE
jgi:hypothetical protein